MAPLIYSISNLVPARFPESDPAPDSVPWLSNLNLKTLFLYDRYNLFQRMDSLVKGYIQQVE